MGRIGSANREKRFRAKLVSRRTIAEALIRHLPLGVFREKNFD
jgi:hypothetical protein